MSNTDKTDANGQSLKEWNMREIDAALDEIEQSAAWQAMYRAENLQLDPLAHCIAGEAAAAHAEGLTEAEFWRLPNDPITWTLDSAGIPPADAPAQIAAAVETLKRYELWYW